MAMSIGATDESPLSEINTTPLIDVLLVLLIMLIITLPAMTHAIKLETPTSGEAVQSELLSVLVDFDGAVLWNGIVIGSMSELEHRMQIEARKSPQVTLNVSADRRAKYDTVAHVLAIAQRSGMRRIAIAGSE